MDNVYTDGEHTRKYTVSRKKRTKCFIISPITLGQFWWNLVYRILNKYASKWCKSYSPRLNNVSTLPCETWNAQCTRATVEVIQKETPEFITPQLWPLNSPDLNLVDNSMWEMLQEKMYKHALLLWSYLQRYWRMSSAVTAQPSFRPNWPTPFSVAVSVHPDQWHLFCTAFLAIVLTRCNQLDSNLTNLESTVIGATTIGTGGDWSPNF